MSITVVDTLTELRRRLAAWRDSGTRIGLVPTMGNLHDGHLTLVEHCLDLADRSVVSLFVNPTQFNPGEDYEAYPRTIEEDLAALERQGCDLAWIPSVETMYPLPEAFRLHVPSALADCLCGSSRPGHFDGVATVVQRLFNQVQPDLAVFGEKDYQQLLVIRQMVLDLAVPTDIVGVATVREPDGLAMSSRNGYLDEQQRRAAPTLYRVLATMAAGLAAGKEFEALQQRALEELQANGLRPDYLEWRSAADLGTPGPDEPSRVFGAAWLGKARLIDNVAIP